MSMRMLVQEVTECVDKEYGRAGDQYGSTHHSDHESYAVLLEELHESEQEIGELKKALADFWYFVRHDYTDRDKFRVCEHIQKRALWAACEMIQVAAMAKKAAMTIRARGAIKEFEKEDSE